MPLDMEAKLAVLAKDSHAKKERDLVLSECSAHSVLWVFGLFCEPFVRPKRLKSPG